MYFFLGTLSGVTVAGVTSTSGSWSYLLNSPRAILFDVAGFMYILDSGNARIQKWWPGATYGTTLVATAFSGPVGMQLDRANNLVVADTGNHRIVSFGLLCRKYIVSKKKVYAYYFNHRFSAPATTTTTAPPSEFSMLFPCY